MKIETKYSIGDKVVFDGSYAGENGKMCKVSAIVREIGDLVKAGKTLDQVLEWARTEVDKFAMYFFADDLKFFRRSGRVSGLAATMGTLIGVRPLIHMSQAGKMESIGTVFSSANERLLHGQGVSSAVCRRKLRAVVHPFRRRDDLRVQLKIDDLSVVGHRRSHLKNRADFAHREALGFDDRENRGLRSAAAVAAA